MLLNSNLQQLIQWLHKRDAYNIIGRIIKPITGNLDDKDAEYCDKIIDDLQNNQKIIQIQKQQR